MQLLDRPSSSHRSSRSAKATGWIILDLSKTSPPTQTGECINICDAVTPRCYPNRRNMLRPRGGPDHSQRDLAKTQDASRDIAQEKPLRYIWTSGAALQPFRIGMIIATTHAQ